MEKQIHLSEERPDPLLIPPHTEAAIEPESPSVRQNQEELTTAAFKHIEFLEAEVNRLVQQSQQRNNRALFFVSASTLLLPFLWIVIMLSSSDDFHTEYAPISCFYLCTLLGGLGFLGWLIRSQIRLRRRSEKLALALTSQDDVRSVGPLTDLLKLPSENCARTSIEALTHLLPRLRTGDDNLLHLRHRARLWSRLNQPVEALLGDVHLGDIHESYKGSYQREIAFRVAILQAFTQVGDSRAMNGVTKLAQSKPTNAGEAHIQQAAQVCLTALQERANRQYSHQTLLRASSASATSSEFLLRPAQGSQATDPDQLLRPGSPDL